MAKTHPENAHPEKAEKTKEAHPHSEAKGEHKADAKADHKPEHKAEPKKEGGKSKLHEPLPGHCQAWGCKAMSHRFNFCDQHFEHFKFGLLRKTGEPAADYEKKFDHFMAYQARMKSQKVA